MTGQRKEFPGGRALLIGIGKGYSGHLELPDVVRHDAEALGVVLRDPDLCGYPASQVRLLLDADATRVNILSALRELVDNAKPSDTVIIFFSGHGGHWTVGADPFGYICPADYVFLDPENTGIKTDELSNLVNAIPAARVVLILDACHAEAAAVVKSDEAKKGFLPQGLRAPVLQKLSSGSGRVVLASCSENERSYTYSAKGQSLFTHFLLEGLKGAAPEIEDGVIGVLDLFIYLSREVPARPQRGEVQTPVILMRGKTNFPLALRRGGWLKGVESPIPASNPARAPAATTRASSVDPRRLERVLAILYPTGPLHDEIWSRAGGDVSTLRLSGSGKASWHAAVKAIDNGGGGAGISYASLIAAALDEYPSHSDLLELSGS
ncbi:caspase family protein [Roseateles sp. P5_E4]